MGIPLNYSGGPTRITRTLMKGRRRISEKANVTMETDKSEGQATSRGMLAASRSWKSQRMDCPLEPLKGTRHADTLVLVPQDSF